MQCYDDPAHCNFTSTCGTERAHRFPHAAAAGRSNEQDSGSVTDVKADPSWRARGASAYAGLSRTDPDAVWSFQGWAFVGWQGDTKASWLRGFVEVCGRRLHTLRVSPALDHDLSCAALG